MVCNLMAVHLEVDVANRVRSMVENGSWEQLSLLLDEIPRLATQKLPYCTGYSFTHNLEGLLIGIVLSYNNVPLFIVTKLVCINRFGLQVPDGQGQFPLHKAIDRYLLGNIDVEVVKYLIKEHASPIKSPVGHSVNPDLVLHLILAKPGCIDLVDCLLEHYPGAIILKGSRDLYPIQIALLNGYPLEQIRRMHISLAGHGQVELAFTFVTHALKGRCSEDVLQFVCDIAVQSITMYDVRIGQKASMFCSCFAEALKSSTSFAPISKLTGTSWGQDVCNDLQCAHDMLLLLYDHGNSFINNCSDTCDVSCNVCDMYNTLLVKFPELADPRRGKSTLQHAIERRAPDVILLDLINKLNPAGVLSDTITIPRTDTYITVCGRKAKPTTQLLSTKCLILHAALRARCSKSVVAALIQAYPESVLINEQVNGLSGDSPFLLAVAHCDDAVIELIFNATSNHIPPVPVHFWSGCFIRVMCRKM